MSDSLRDFDLGGEDVTLDEHIEVLESLSGSLRDDQISRLWLLLATVAPPSDEQVKYGADFDLAAEVSMQIMAVRAMRESVLPGGRVRPGVPAREIKEVITASSTLLNTLLKTHEKIMSYERMRAIEEAVNETIDTLPEEAQKTFMTLLEASLSEIE